MKKVASLILSFAIILMCVPYYTMAAENVAYVSADGAIEGFSGTVHTAFANALAALGSESGTIYVDGTVVLPTKPDTSAIAGKTVTIRGYGNSADGNVVEFAMSRVAFAPTKPCNIVFDNITLKRQDGTTNECYISPNGSTITFGTGCQYLDGLRTSNNNVLKLWVGSSSVSAGGTINFNSSAADFAEVASMGGYFDNNGYFTINDDITYNFGAGKFSIVYGGLRNSIAGYSTLNGDVTYNFNGGTFGKELYFGSYKNGIVNGNIVFNFNGGEFSASSLYIGSKRAFEESEAAYGNAAAIINADKIIDGGKAFKLTVADVKKLDSVGKHFLVINHADELEAADNVAVTVTSTSLDYYLKVNGGALTPVFEKSSGGNIGEFLGFSASADVADTFPAIGTTLLEKSPDGYYTVPESANIQNINFLTVDDAVTGDKVYVSTDGVIEGYDGKVYTDVASALGALGTDGGTVFVDGTVLLPTAPDTTKFAGKSLTFLGYKNKADGNVVEFPSSGIVGFIPKSDAEIIFDNITLKRADGGTNESWISPRGGSITFGSGCLYRDGTRITDNTSTNGTALKLHIGGYSSTSAGTINFNTAAAEYAEVGTLAGYFGGTTSAFTVSGDYIYNFNAGKINSIYGGLRNSFTGFATLNGDVYYNFNGATLPSGKALATGNYSNGIINGNIFFTFNGGAISRTLTVGSKNSINDSYNAYGSTVITINSESIKDTADAFALTISDGSIPTKMGDVFLIVNDKDAFDQNASASLTVNSTNIDYYITTVGGTIAPVFEKSRSGAVGKLLGFEAIPDVTGHIPAIDGAMLEKNEDGYYTLEKSASVQNVTFATREELVSKITFASGISGQENISDTYKNGTELVLPACSFVPESGKVFSGWQYEGQLYHEGDTVVIKNDMTFTAHYVAEADVSYLYLSENGSDSGNGLTVSTALRTLDGAVKKAESLSADDISIHIIGNITSDTLGTDKKTLTFRNGTINGNIFLSGDVVFDNVTMTEGTVYTSGNSVIFTENVNTAEGFSLVLADKQNESTNNSAILMGGSFSSVSLSENTATFDTYLAICGASIGTFTLGSSSAKTQNVVLAVINGDADEVLSGAVPATGLTVYRETEAVAIPDTSKGSGIYTEITNGVLDGVVLESDGTLVIPSDKYAYAMGESDCFYSVDGKIAPLNGAFVLYETKGQGVDHLPYPVAPDGTFFDTWQSVSDGYVKAVFTQEKRYPSYYVSQNGNDEYFGTSQNAPKKTLTSALSAIGDGDGRVVVMDTLYWSESASVTNAIAHKGTVIFEGLDENNVASQIIDYSYSSAENSKAARLDLYGNSIFKNVTFRAHHHKSFYTNGYDLRFEGKIGYEKGVSGNSVMTLHIGKYGSSSVKGGNVYLSADCEIGSVSLGHNGMSSVSGDINLVIDGSDVSEIIVCGTGSKINNADILYLSGSIGSIYTNPTYTTSAINGTLRIIRNDGLAAAFDNKANTPISGRLIDIACEDGVVVVPTVDNEYSVLENKTVIAKNTGSGKEYVSPKGGVMILPVGSYEIRLSDTDYYTNDGSKITIISDIALTYDDNLFRKERDNAQFIGWYYDSKNDGPASGEILGAGCVLEARFAEFSDSEFGVLGSQIRKEGNALRFVIDKKTAFDEKFNITEFGAVVMPTRYLSGRELLRDTFYNYNDRVYLSQYTEAYKIFDTYDGGMQYTLCLTGISPENYDFGFTTRGYAVIKTINDEEFIVYTTPKNSSIIKVAKNIPRDENDREIFESSIKAWKDTYFGGGTTPTKISAYPTAYTVNETGVIVREIDISAKNDGAVTTIAMITDSHLNSGSTQKSTALINAMACARFSDQIVLGGDNIESASSDKNLALIQEIVFEPYPEAIAVLGNHEYFYPGSGSMDAVKEKVDAVWPHNPDYYSKLVGDKVLVVGCDNARQPEYGVSKYYFTEEKCELLERDIEYARENGYVILLFVHVGINKLDRTYMANDRMYNLITSNADVIKACFSGHDHTDAKTEIAATYPGEDGTPVATKLPCYWLESCSENNFQGNVLFINVD